MEKNKATIVTHQMWADLYSSNGLINYYSKLYNELIVFIIDEPRKCMLEDIFRDKSNIKFVIPNLHHNFNGVDGCLNCHMYGNPHFCPRDSHKKCQFIDYSNYPESEYDNIKIGCFNVYHLWEEYRSNNPELSFAHCFYGYNGLPLNVRINDFHVYRDTLTEGKTLYEFNYNKGEYIVYHDDQHRGINIHKNKLPDSFHYQLNGVSDNMIDQIPILENAKELHFIDSNYSVLIYFLSFQNENIKKIPKYLHAYSRPGRDIGIYNNPTPENWFVI
jgi:hypothetical protein